MISQMPGFHAMGAKGDVPLSRIDDLGRCAFGSMTSDKVG